MTEETDNMLLNQRIEQLERQNATLFEEVKTARSAIDEAKGRQGFVAFVAPIFIGLGGIVFGSVVWASLESARDLAQANQLAVTTLQSEVATAARDRGDIHMRKAQLREEFDEHTTEVGHPRITERMKVIESAVAEHSAAQKLTAAEVTRIDGLVERAHVFITQNQDDIEKHDSLIEGNGHSIGAMAASTQANFQEVETQIRSMAEVRLTELRAVDRLVSLLWQKVFDTSLPDYDHHPSKIPASATSTLGEIKTNGK